MNLRIRGGQKNNIVCHESENKMWFIRALFVMNLRRRFGPESVSCHKFENKVRSKAASFVMNVRIGCVPKKLL